MECLCCNLWTPINVIPIPYFDSFTLMLKTIYLEKETGFDASSPAVLPIRPEYIQKEHSEGYTPNCPGSLSSHPREVLTIKNEKRMRCMISGGKHQEGGVSLFGSHAFFEAEAICING
jgi:hypothetical protein